jgi:hypothetical protein
MKIRFAFLLMVVGLVATVSSCTQRSLDALNPCTILQVPRLVELLLSGGESEPTAVGTFPAIESLHVGVITPDLGHSTVPPHSFIAGPDASTDFYPTDDCMRMGGAGKAGSMQVAGYQGDPRVACEAQTPPDGTFYLNYNTGDDRVALVNDVTCITGQGTDGMWGCGFEQQLESIVASDRSTVNVGFNRDGALLAVILITDEDDCSTTDPRVFDIGFIGTETTEERPSNPLVGPTTSRGEPQFNLRCSAHSDQLRAVEDYVSGIASLKPDPSQVVFAAITGIPMDATLDRDEFDTDEDRYAAILDHGAMAEIPNPADDDARDQQLTPACTASDDAGSAAPGRRIVETMKGLAQSNTGVGTVVESICAEDYAPALDEIVDRIAAALRQLCLPRPLNRNSPTVGLAQKRRAEAEKKWLSAPRTGARCAASRSFRVTPARAYRRVLGGSTTTSHRKRSTPARSIPSSSA